MRVPAVIVCAMALILVAGCGSIGEPLYPALHIPSRVTDLTVAERGDQLDLRFTLPPLTTEGLPVKELAGVDLRVGPGPANGWNQEEWAAAATSVPIPVPAKPGPVRASIPAAKFIGGEVIVAVRLSNAKGRDAGWSEFKVFNVRTPIADPRNFRAAGDPKGVLLTWNASGPGEFRIFRKTEQQQAPVLLATATEPNYTDISAEFGKTYQYSIQAIREGIESNLVGPETITPSDVFPPAVPTGLTASVGVGAVELAWNRNAEPGFKEYRVLRSEEGGPFTEIAKGLGAPVYSDATTQTGKHYRYEIAAVGMNGQSSAPSAPVEITAP